MLGELDETEWPKFAPREEARYIQHLASWRNKDVNFDIWQGLDVTTQKSHAANHIWPNQQKDGWVDA